MKKRVPPGAGKWILAAVVAVSLGTIGLSYAAWSDQLQAMEKMTTGVFQMAFSCSGRDYTASITDAAGNPVEDLAGVGVQFTDREGKSVTVTFQNGLPLGRLLKGDLVKLTYPLENKDGTVTEIKQYEPDFTVPWQTVELEAQSQSLVLDGREYQVDNIPAGYAVSLEFDVFRSFADKAGSVTGSLYFKLTDESRTWIGNLPQTLEFSREVLDAASSAPTAAAGGQNGVLVVYTCSVPIGLDQGNADDGIARAGEGGAGT